MIEAKFELVSICTRDTAQYVTANARPARLRLQWFFAYYVI